MRFWLSIDCDNDAFADHLDLEVATLLRALAQQVGEFGNGGPWPIFDPNGNRVGEARFEEDGDARR